MGKHLKNLVIILSIILIGCTAFATPEPTAEVIQNDDTVVVTRKKKEEVKEPQKDETTKVKTKQEKEEKPKKEKTKKKTKPQYLGLKIYKKPKTKTETKKVEKKQCIDDPESICNARRLKSAKPFEKIKAPRYSRTYDNKYRKSRPTILPPVKPAEAIPIINCY